MQSVDRPNIGTGTIPQQIEQIKTYLLRSNEQINLILFNLATDSVKDKIISEILSSQKNLSFKDISVLNMFIGDSIEVRSKGKRYFGKTREVDIGNGYLCFANGIFIGYKIKESGT